MRGHGAANAVGPGGANAISHGAENASYLGVGVCHDLTGARLRVESDDEFAEFGKPGGDGGVELRGCVCQTGLLQMLAEVFEFAAQVHRLILELFGDIRGGERLKVMGILFQLCKDLVPSPQTFLVQWRCEGGLDQARLAGRELDRGVRHQLVDCVEGLLRLGSHRVDPG